MSKERFKVTPAVYLILRKDNNLLLSRRKNTGWHDGEYSLPSGHLEGNETLIQAMRREAKEEIGIEINPEDLKLVHITHRKQPDQERLDFFFSCEKWGGEPNNREPEKCDDLRWYEIGHFPPSAIPYIKQGIEQSSHGVLYSEHGWS